MNEDLAKINDEIQAKASVLNELTEKLKYEFSDGYKAVNKLSEIRAKLKDDYEKKSDEIHSTIDKLRKETENSKAMIEEFKQNKPSVELRQEVQKKRFLFFTWRKTKTIEDHSALDKWEEELLQIQTDSENIYRKIEEVEAMTEQINLEFNSSDKQYALTQAEYKRVLKQASEKICLTVGNFH